MSVAAKTLWTITIVFWTSLFILTHIPQIRVPRIAVGDKTAHLIAYIALAYVLGISMSSSGPRRRDIPFRVLIICTLYAAFDELTQDLVGRYAEWRDFKMDIAGTLLACYVLMLSDKWRRWRDTNSSSEQFV